MTKLSSFGRGVRGRWEWPGSTLVNFRGKHERLLGLGVSHTSSESLTFPRKWIFLQKSNFLESCLCLNSFHSPF